MPAKRKADEETPERPTKESSDDQMTPTAVPVPATTGEARGPRLRVKLVRSVIGHRAGARGTVRALGLHRISESVEIDDTPENRGMLRRIAFLLEVTEPADASADGGGDR